MPATPSTPSKAKSKQSPAPPETLAPLPPARTFNWISSFPGPDELESFIRNTVNNASIARTCLKEAKDTKQRLQEALQKGETYVKQCDERISQRQRAVAEYQEAVNLLRTKAGR